MRMLDPPQSIAEPCIPDRYVQHPKMDVVLQFKKERKRLTNVDP